MAHSLHHGCGGPCGLCKPWKLVGNSATRWSAADTRRADSARDQLKETR